MELLRGKTASVGALLFLGGLIYLGETGYAARVGEVPDPLPYPNGNLPAVERQIEQIEQQKPIDEVAYQGLLSERAGVEATLWEQTMWGAGAAAVGATLVAVAAYRRKDEPGA